MIMFKSFIKILILFIYYSLSNTRICKCSSVLENDIEKCYLNKTCQDQYAICVDGKCQCKANYWKHQEDHCVKFDCNDNEQCRLYDKNRICKKPWCICPEPYLTDYNTGEKCVTKNSRIEKQSSNSTLNKNCNKQEDCSSQYQRCLAGFCRCDPDYKDVLNECQVSYCNYDTDCSSLYDPYRKCHSKQCICELGYHPDAVNKGSKCISIPGYTPSPAPTWWIYVLCLVVWPLILFSILYCCWRRRRRIKRRGNITSAIYPRQNNVQVNILAPQTSTGDQATSPPFIISNNRPGRFSNFFQRLSGNYEDPPPSYDSIPGISTDSSSVQVLNVSHLNNNVNHNYNDNGVVLRGAHIVAEHLELQDTELSKPSTRNDKDTNDFQGTSSDFVPPSYEDSLNMDRPTKMEQLSMQL